jgi:hypothetical protein
MKLSKPAAANKLLFLAKTANLHKESANVKQKLLELLLNAKNVAKATGTKLYNAADAVGKGTVTAGRNLKDFGVGTGKVLKTVGKGYGKAVEVAPYTTGLATMYFGKPVADTAINLGVVAPLKYTWDKTFPTPVMDMGKK